MPSKCLFPHHPTVRIGCSLNAQKCLHIKASGHGQSHSSRTTRARSVTPRACSPCLRAQSCLTWQAPWTGPPGSSVHASLARILEWAARSSPRDPSNPGIKPASPTLAGLESSPLSHLGNPAFMLVTEAQCLLYLLGSTSLSLNFLNNTKQEQQCPPGLS